MAKKQTLFLNQPQGWQSAFHSISSRYPHLIWGPVPDFWFDLICFDLYCIVLYCLLVLRLRRIIEMKAYTLRLSGTWYNCATGSRTLSFWESSFIPFFFLISTSIYASLFLILMYFILKGKEERRKERRAVHVLVNIQGITLRGERIGKWHFIPICKCIIFFSQSLSLRKKRRKEMSLLLRIHETSCFKLVRVILRGRRRAFPLRPEQIFCGQTLLSFPILQIRLRFLQSSSIAMY